MAAGRNIKGVTIEIDGDTTKLTKAIKNAESQIRQSKSGLKDINNLLKADPGNTDLLTQKYKLLGTEIEGAESKLTTLKEAQEQMVREGKVGTDKYDALQREIVETEQKLKNLTTEMKNFGSVSAQKVAVAGEKVKAVGGQIEGVGQSLMPVSAAITAAGTVAVAKFAEVDKTMTLTNKTMGNSEAQAKLLNQAMKDAAMNSTFGMSDAANASLNFARAGLTAEEAAAALAPAMNLAAGEGGNLDTVSAGLVATINGFGDSFNNTTRYADVFAAACNNSALDVDSLSGAMSIAAPIFKTAGYSVDDAALYMGVMANNGIEASEAANGLKTGLARLISPAKDGSDAMASLGLITVDSMGNVQNAFINADGSMKDSIEVQKILHDKFADLSESEQIAAASAIFGKNQMSKWLALINTAPEDVQALSTEIKGCAGTTDEMAEAMMSGFGGSLEKLKSSIDVATESFGEALAPAISKVADAVQKAVDWFNSLDENQQQAIATAALVVAAAGPVLVIVGKILTAIGSFMTFVPQIVGAVTSISGFITGTAIPAIGGALSSIGGVIATAAPLIAAIGLVIAAAVLWVKHWDEIKEAGRLLVERTIEHFNDLKEKLTGVFDNIKEAANTLKERTVEHFENLKERITGVFDNIKEAANTLKERTAEHFENLKERITGVFDNIKEAANTLKERTAEHFENLKEKLSNVFNNIKEAAQTFVSGVVEKFENFKQRVGTVIDNVKAAFQTFKDRLGEIAEGIKQKIENLKAGIQEKFNAIKQHISDAVTNIKSTIDGWKQKFEDLKSGISSAIENMKQKIESFKQKFDNIKSHISNIVDWLKGCFNFSWKLPDLKLPHFNISGSFSLDPPSVPHFSVDWYAKAMERGMILNSPTIFGMANGRLLGGGEAGSEAVVGTASLQSMITGAVQAAGAGGDIVIPVYIGSNRLETMVVKAEQISNYRSGGR